MILNTDKLSLTADLAKGLLTSLKIREKKDLPRLLRFFGFSFAIKTEKESFTPRRMQASLWKPKQGLPIRASEKRISAFAFFSARTATS
jgi:hypothetical protein